MKTNMIHQFKEIMYYYESDSDSDDEEENLEQTI